ncbi:hypothetical protein Pcinc_032498 [Petrolisthes cinctipes]|uniref:Transposase Tc1-like domain-containing protein n=1 Tax=Petrolisthes cinctipes TaxID=88211 RepID=A0AAE1EUC9_PETCI|nr:hypothetical protein Pcinc_032498 [Petrolisthes cinctipes]
MRLMAASPNLPTTTISQYKRRCGRPRKTTKLTDHLLKIAMTRNPRLTTKGLKNMYPKLVAGVAVQTIQHRLQHHLATPSSVATLKPRIDFALAHKNWTVDDWKHVLWSDESTFQFVANHRVHVRRPILYVP